MSELGLIFRGPNIAPETLDAEQALGVAMAYVEALTTVAKYDWGTDAPPFMMTLKSVSSGSVAMMFGYKPRDVKLDYQQIHESWTSAPRRLGEYAQSAHSGPKQVGSKLLSLFKRTQQLPPDVSALVVQAHLWSWSLTEAARRAPIPVTTSKSTFRARILTVGGNRPRVRLSCKGDTVKFSVSASPDVAKQAGKLLYAPVDVTARLTRLLEHPYTVIDGKIEAIRELSQEDPVQAFDKWYAGIGRPLLDDEGFKDNGAGSEIRDRIEHPT